VILEIPVERGARDAQCLADGVNVRLPAGVERPREVELLGIGELPRPAATSSPGPRRRHSRMGAFADEIPLELSQRPEDMEDQLPSGGGGINLFGERLEANPPLRQGGDDLDQMPKGTPQAIEAPDHQRIALP